MDIEKLYREYFTPVYRYTLSLVHDPDMAVTLFHWCMILTWLRRSRRRHFSER